jgi:hypothetical protein
MPFLFSNRSFYNCYYEIDGSEPGEYQFISSGVGNEKFQEKFSKVAGKDVIGTVNLNYIAIKPVKDHTGAVTGTQVIQVQSVNLNGHIPEMYETKVAKRSATSIKLMLAYL